jgi:hypothetical protein
MNGNDIQLRLAAMDFALRTELKDQDAIRVAQAIYDFLTNSTTITEVVA